MTTSNPRQPDYILKGVDKEGNKSGPLGGAWKNNDGSIGLRIGVGVVLTRELTLRLFPHQEPAAVPHGAASKRGNAALTGGSKRKPVPGFNDMDDDIPF